MCRCTRAPGVGAGPPGLGVAILVPGTQPAMQYSRLRLQAPPAWPWVGPPTPAGGRHRENGMYDPSSICLPQRQARRAGGERGTGREDPRAAGAVWCLLVLCRGPPRQQSACGTAWMIAGWKAEAWWKGFAVAQNTSSKRVMIRATRQAVCPSPSYRGPTPTPPLRGSPALGQRSWGP